MAESPENHVDRRSFLSVLLAVVTAAVAAFLSIPLVRFAIYPLTRKPTEILWASAGAESDLLRRTQAAGGVLKLIIRVEQRDGWRKVTSDKAIYVIAQNAGLRVLSPICPHLGCPIRWSKESNLFLCPCHGGKFASNGRYVSGPPPRSMDELETKVENGQLQVRYQYFRSLVSTKEPMG